MLGSSQELKEKFPSFQVVLILNLVGYHWIQYLGWKWSTLILTKLKIGHHENPWLIFFVEISDTQIGLWDLTQFQFSAIMPNFILF
jgi:hypothetical protein